MSKERVSELRVSVRIELQKSINRLSVIALLPAGPMRLTGNRSCIRLLESFNAHLSPEEPWRRPRPPGGWWGVRVVVVGGGFSLPSQSLCLFCAARLMKLWLVGQLDPLLAPANQRQSAEWSETRDPHLASRGHGSAPCGPLQRTTSTRNDTRK